MRKKEISFVFTALLIVLTYSINSFGAPGDLDPTFGEAGKVITPVGTRGFAVDLKILSDGKIITLGNTDVPNSGNSDIALVRYNPNGSLDTSFGANGIFILSETGRQDSKSLFIQSDGKYVVAAHDNNKVAVYRFNTDGSLDTGYGVNGKFVFPNESFSLASDVLIQPDDKIVVAGRTSTNSIVFRLNSNGLFDTGFNGTGLNSINTGRALLVALEKDNRLLVLGSNSSSGYFCRLNSDGTISTPPMPLPIQVVPTSKISFQNDGKIVIGGNAPSEFALFGEFALTRFNADLTLDTSFGNGGIIMLRIVADKSYATSVIVQPNGQMIVGGYSATAFVLTRFNSNGFLDMTFGNSGKVLTSFGFAAHSVFNSVQQADGKIVMLGNNGNGGFTLLRHVLTGTPNAIAPKTLYDFNGDRRADLAVFRPSTKTWYVTPDFVGSFFSKYSGSQSGLLAPADYDGDGKTDPAVFVGPDWNICPNLLFGCTLMTVGSLGDIPVSGDFDGDGKADPTAFRDGNWSYRSTSYGMIFNYQFGQANDKPVPADFDGDGRADFAVYRPSVGDWYFLRSSDGSFGGVNFGLASDLPVPADYDGDGKTDIAVYRPSAGDWYWLNSSNGSFTGIHWGTNGDKPVPADYDGDGKADIAVYRSSDAIWYLYQSTNGFRAVNWGLSSDLPAPNAYIR